MNYFAFYLSIVVVLSVNSGFVSGQGDTFNSTVKFFRGPTVNDYVSFTLTTAQNVANDPGFRPTAPVVVFVHGWQQTPLSPGSQVLLNAFLRNNSYNILALDWSQLASNIFLDYVAQRVDPLGKAFALFIDRLNSQKGIPFPRIHLIGHSMGAHVAGAAGKYTVQWSGNTKSIGRITGLDPGYYAYDFLSWHKAKFVDIIHTDADGLGTNQNTGHVDYWPNGGLSIQPGCPEYPITLPETTCSHMRAMDFFAESVVRGSRAGNFLSVNMNNPNIVIEMGMNAPTNAQGYYSLTTNAASWYSKS